MVNTAREHTDPDLSLSSLPQPGSDATPIHPLKAERMKRNLTQRMLADFALVSLASVQRAEAGLPIRVTTRKLLCDYFNMTPGELELIAQNEPLQMREIPSAKPQPQQSTPSNVSSLPSYPRLELKETPRSFREGVQLGIDGSRTDCNNHETLQSIEQVWAFLLKEISPEAVEQQNQQLATMRLIAQEIPLEKRVGYLVGYLTSMFSQR